MPLEGQSGAVAGRVGAEVSDHVELLAQSRGREAALVHRGDVDEGYATGDAIGEYLPDGRAHEEAVAGEPAGVEEPREFLGLTDERIVVGSHLVQARPPVPRFDLAEVRCSGGDVLGKGGRPVRVPLVVERP